MNKPQNGIKKMTLKMHEAIKSTNQTECHE